MPHRLSHHLLEAVIWVVTTATTAIVPVLAETVPVEQTIEMRLLLIPLVGAMIIAGGMIMLNPKPETKRIVVGRALFALFFGTLLPQLVSYFVPVLKDVALKPAFLLALGGCVAGVAYVLSKPFCGRLYQRADHIADQQVKRLEETITRAVKSEMKSDQNP